MARKLFGTDGVRGQRQRRADDRRDGACGSGRRPGAISTDGSHAHRVVIGKDTRRSGYMLENALTAGLHLGRHERASSSARCRRRRSGS